MESLLNRHCQPVPAGSAALTDAELSKWMVGLPDWERDGKRIVRRFEFKNYFRTMAFVNAVAWIAHREDHHPDMEVGYNRCVVRFSTHSIGGLSMNDLICAAKIDALGGF